METVDPNRCDDCFFNCMAESLSYVFCCRKMKSATRIKILWTWLIVLSTASCLILGCVIFSPYEFMSSPSDMRPIRKHIDFLFCEKVKVTSPFFRFNGYVVSGNLEMSRDTTEFHQNTAIDAEPEAFKIIPFYFLPSTKLNLKNQLQNPVTVRVYLIKGRENLDTWKQHRSCDNCFIVKKDLSYQVKSEGWLDNNEISYIVTDEDEYYLVYSNEDTAMTWVDINIDINRTMYDISKATLYYENVNECSLELVSPKDTALIWIHSDDDIAQSGDTAFTTECVPRIWAYLLIHGIPVLFLGLSCSVVLQKLCRIQGDSGPSERSPLLDSERPPSYNSVVLSPPKYEDIVRSDELPSYAQAVASLSQDHIICDNSNHSFNAQTVPPDAQTVSSDHTETCTLTVSDDGSGNQPEQRPLRVSCNSLYITDANISNASSTSTNFFPR